MTDNPEPLSAEDVIGVHVGSMRAPDVLTDLSAAGLTICGQDCGCSCLAASERPPVEPPTTNPTRADVWYTPDCGHLHLSDDGVVHAACPDGVRHPVDPLREALEIIAAKPEHAPDAIGVTARNIARAALASPATPRPDSDLYWAKYEGVVAGMAATPRPEGLDVERVANAIFESMVRPEVIWWDDLTPELQEPYLRAARAVARLSDTGERPTPDLSSAAGQPLNPDQAHEWPDHADMSVDERR